MVSNKHLHVEDHRFLFTSQLTMSTRLWAASIIGCRLCPPNWDSSANSVDNLRPVSVASINTGFQIGAPVIMVITRSSPGHPHGGHLVIRSSPGHPQRGHLVIWSSSRRSSGHQVITWSSSRRSSRHPVILTAVIWSSFRSSRHLGHPHEGHLVILVSSVNSPSVTKNAP